MILDQIIEKRKEQLAREIAYVSRSEMINRAISTKRLTKDFLGAIRFGGSYMRDFNDFSVLPADAQCAPLQRAASISDCGLPAGESHIDVLPASMDAHTMYAPQHGVITCRGAHCSSAVERSHSGTMQSVLHRPLSVIAEVKKASPSKGLIQPNFDPVAIATAYEQAGANAISVLTEEHYFQGSSEVFRQVRKAVALPMLRKDFVFDAYQIYEARAMGADAVLLIVSVLPQSALQEFLLLAQSLCLSALVEVHDEKELATALACGANLIGINNRNLKTFEVSLDTTKRLAALLPKDRVLVSESGIATNADMKQARASGADAVLIGETLMRSSNISETMRTLRAGV